MTAERVTASLPPEVLAEARGAVNAGTAESLSAYVATALRNQSRREHALVELARVLGGPPPLEALQAVRRDLGLEPLPTSLIPPGPASSARWAAPHSMPSSRPAHTGGELAESRHGLVA